MAAGLVTPTEAGMGPSVLNIAASIGAKIRDAAQDAKEERQKAAEKGETPKKGSLFKSSLANQFNPIKSKKAKSSWAKQFDWNKKTESDQQVKPPTGGDGDSKGKLKEFIAGGFTAILKDTGLMVSKLDGVKMMTGENLSEVTRASSTLTVIKESIDAQTELRRKALEEAKYARAEKKLEKTSDVAGLSTPKQPEEKGAGADKEEGGGPFDWLWKALGIADLAENFIPGKWLQKLNPFKKPKVTTGGAKPPGVRMPGSGPKITTSGGAPAPKVGSGFNLKNLRPGRGGLLGIGMMGAEMFMPQIQDAMSGFAGALGFGDTKLSDTELIIKILDEQARYKKLAEQNAQLPGGQYLTPSEDEYNFGNLAALKREAARRNLQIPGQKLSEGGIVPSAVPPSPISPMAEGGIAPGLYDNPTKGILSPGQSVIPLNRSEGKAMFGKKASTNPSETAMDTVGAMILGISAGMLGKTDSGTVGDQVKQDIRKASKEFGISNLTFTSSIGRGQFGKVDTNKDAKDFMRGLFEGVQISGGGGGGKKGGGGGGGNPPGGTPESLKGDLEADIGKSGAEMKDEIMQSGATGIVDPTQQPWCAAYVNSQLKRQGIQGSGSALADSFEKWGAPVDKNNIQYGDVIVGDYGGGSRSHVMFAAGSPKDGAVEIIGGNQSGKVTRGSIALDKIDYVRRAGAQPPALPTARKPGQQPTPTPTTPQPKPPANPTNKPNSLPVGSVRPIANPTTPGAAAKPAEGGLAGILRWLTTPMGQGKDKNFVNSARNAAASGAMGKEAYLLNNRRAQTDAAIQQMLGRESGGATTKAEVMRRNAAKLKAQRASEQRSRLGVQKVNGKWVNMGVSDRAVGSNPWWQVWNKKGATAERKAKQEKLAKSLAERLNKQEAAKLKPAKPSPSRQPVSSGGTRPAPSSSGQSSTPAAVVMPPASATKAPTAQAVGSFGSAVPAAKTSAMVFADFLYPDLV